MQLVPMLRGFVSQWVMIWLLWSFSMVIGLDRGQVNIFSAYLPEIQVSDALAAPARHCERQRWLALPLSDLFRCAESISACALML